MDQYPGLILSEWPYRDVRVAHKWIAYVCEKARMLFFLNQERASLDIFYRVRKGSSKKPQSINHTPRERLPNYDSRHSRSSRDEMMKKMGVDLGAA